MTVVTELLIAVMTVLLMNKACMHVSIQYMPVNICTCRQACMYALINMKARLHRGIGFPFRGTECNFILLYLKGTV